jgi:hypothetical protein
MKPTPLAEGPLKRQSHQQILHLPHGLFKQGWPALYPAWHDNVSKSLERFQLLCSVGPLAGLGALVLRSYHHGNPVYTNRIVTGQVSCSIVAWRRRSFSTSQTSRGVLDNTTYWP